MAVIQFPSASPGSYLCGVALYRKPDGSVTAVVRDMPVEVIEATGHDVPSRIEVIAGWLDAAAEQTRSLAVALTEPPHDH